MNKSFDRDLKNTFKAFDEIKASDELIDKLNKLNPSKKMTHGVLKLALASAVIIFLFFKVSALYNIQKETFLLDNPNLEKIQLNEEYIKSFSSSVILDNTGSGFPKLPISEIPKTLPVYKNSHYLEPKGTNTAPVIEEEFLQKSREISNEFSSNDFDYISPKEELNQYTIMSNENLELTIYPPNRFSLYFKKYLTYPKEFKNDYETSNNVINYYYDIYKNKIKKVFSKEYNRIENICSYQDSLEPNFDQFLYNYDETKNNKEILLDYFFDRLYIDYSKENGDLYLIENFYSYNNSPETYLGEYPIMDMESGKKNAISYFQIKEENIKHITLSYKTFVNEKDFLIPYYTFYVETEKIDASHSKYSILYFPALDEDYIEKSRS